MMKKYKVSAVNDSGIFTFHRNEHGKLEDGNGVDLKLLTVLAEKLNFRYEIVEAEDGEWGSKEADGNWTGIIGIVTRKEADLGIDAIFVSYERADAVHFSYPYFIDMTTFAMRAPRLLSKDFVFVYPFHYVVWLLIGFSLFLSSWLLLAFNKRGHQNDKMGNGSVISEWGKQLQILITLFLGQGTYEVFKESVERIFITFWSFSRSVLVYSYTGLLLSFLMIPLKEPSIETLLQLRNAVVKGNFRCLAYRGGMPLSLITSAEDGVVKDFSDSLKQHPEDIVGTTDEALERLKQGGCALFSSRLYFNVFFNKIGPENFFVSNDSVGQNLMSVGFRKDFCCIRDFNKMILRIQAAGLYEKWMRDTFFQLQLKVEREIDEDLIRPLALSDVVGAFWVLLPGYGLSIIILVFEEGIHCFTTRRQRRY